MSEPIGKDIKKVLHDVSPSIFAIREISDLLIEMTRVDFDIRMLDEVVKGLKNIYELSSTLSLYVNDLKSEIENKKN